MAINYIEFHNNDNDSNYNSNSAVFSLMVPSSDEVVGFGLGWQPTVKTQSQMTWILHINVMDRLLLVSNVMHRHHLSVMTSKGWTRAFTGSNMPYYRPGSIWISRFLHVSRRMQIKKLVHNNTLRLATWSMGTLSGKLMELVDAMIRRRIRIDYGSLEGKT